MLPAKREVNGDVVFEEGNRNVEIEMSKAKCRNQDVEVKFKLGISKLELKC